MILEFTLKSCVISWLLELEDSSVGHLPADLAENRFYRVAVVPWTKRAQFVDIYKKLINRAMLRKKSETKLSSDPLRLMQFLTKF